MSYEGRFYFTIPSDPPQHVMSNAVPSHDELLAAVACMRDLGWSWAMSSAIDGCDPVTSQPIDFAYDFELFKRNACAVCGEQIETHVLPSMLGYGFDYTSSCGKCGASVSDD